MSVSSKNKRKIIYENKTYYWHVSPDYDRADLRKNFDVLNIIAEDKSLELHEPLELLDPVPQSVTPAFVKEKIASALSS